MAHRNNIINFPDRSSEDESFAEFWEGCKETFQHVSYARAKRLYQASPEEYFANAGWVYVLGNQFMADNLFKIGMTTGRIERRMRQLFTTGVPAEFDCVHADWFSDCQYAEAFIHEWLNDYRVDGSREFFQASLDTVRAAFLSCCAVADPCPSHMVEQKLKRERHASLNEKIRGVPLYTPSDLEVPF